jgi:hypothetical protein
MADLLFGLYSSVRISWASRPAEKKKSGVRPLTPPAAGSAGGRGRRPSVRKRLIQLYTHALAATLAGVFAAGLVNEDAAHRFGGRGEKVATAVPGLGLLRVHEPQIRLVNQCRGLQSLARLLLIQLRCRQLAQLVVNQRQELLSGVRVALLDSGQYSGDLGHRRPRASVCVFASRDQYTGLVLSVLLSL